MKYQIKIVDRCHKLLQILPFLFDSDEEAHQYLDLMIKNLSLQYSIIGVQGAIFYIDFKKKRLEYKIEY